MTAKITKPSAALMLGTLAIVLVAGGVAGGYYIGVKRTTSENYSIAQKALNKPPEETPASTISPTQVVQKPQDYAGKEIKLYGQVISMPDNKYTVVGLEAKQPGAIILDFGDSKIDPKPFVANQDIKAGGDEAKPTNTVPVTITGTLVYADGAAPKFTVKSIER